MHLIDQMKEIFNGLTSIYDFLIIVLFKVKFDMLTTQKKKKKVEFGIFGDGKLISS